MSKEEPKLSIFPFEGIMSEIHKLQGDRPCLVVLYTGPQDVVFLRNRLDWKDPEVDIIMNHLTLEILKGRGVDLAKLMKDDEKKES